MAQFKLAWANLKAALEEADMQPANVIRLNIYTPVMDRFMAEAGDMIGVLAGEGVQPVSTLLGVACLFDPDALIELEATAVA